MNDQTAAQMISQSLFESLSDSEKLILEQHMAKSPQSQKYAELSALIQNTLADDEYDDTSNDPIAEPGLSQLARARIAKRIEIELLRLGSETSDSQGERLIRRVAEDSEGYTQSKDDDSGDSSEDDLPETT